MATGDLSLLGKKIGGLFLVILGFLLIAGGVAMPSTGLVIFGTLVLVVGLILMVLKIMRRNESVQVSSPGHGARGPLHHGDVE
jgi:membrane-bound ClpP family serine protease